MDDYTEYFVNLRKALKQGKFEKFELIKDARDQKGWNSIHYAVEFRCLEALKYMIKKGVDVNAIGDNDLTPFSLAVFWKEGALMLLENGATINHCSVPDDVHRVAMYSEPALLEAVIKKKAKVRLKNSYNMTPLQCAVKFSQCITQNTRGHDVLLKKIKILEKAGLAELAELAELERAELKAKLIRSVPDWLESRLRLDLTKIISDNRVNSLYNLIDHYVSITNMVKESSYIIYSGLLNAVDYIQSPNKGHNSVVSSSAAGVGGAVTTASSFALLEPLLANAVHSAILGKFTGEVVVKAANSLKSIITR